MRARWKWLLSFRKSDWDLRDYPLRIRKQQPTDDNPKGFVVPPYHAQIVNWWVISGLGDSPDQAVKDLKESLDAWRASGTALPRPGSRVPIKFADRTQIEGLSHISKEFFPWVLRMEPEAAFVSDESSLWDFINGDSRESLIAKVYRTFRVDISDIEDGNLVRIFERIDSARREGTV